MKRWAFVTVGLYAVLLMALTIPVAILCTHEWLATVNGEKVWSLDFKFMEAAGLFQTWGYWIWLGILVTAQALLLLIPVARQDRRPMAQRRLVVPVVVASFLLANLFFAGALSILSAAMGDEGLNALAMPGEYAEEVINAAPELSAAHASIGRALGGDWLVFSQLSGMLVVFWLVWGLIFHHFAKVDTVETPAQRATKWLLRGSILELLIAVPSHIIVRHREECCAPMVSFWGIVTGLSVMLLSFGPGVLFLFAERIRRKAARGAPPVID